MARKKSSRPAGRPRQFDAGAALDAALQVFWQRGYEGASLSDLTKAMRINRPSLYAAFGDKASLFRRVLDHYSDANACHLAEALAQPTSLGVVRHLLNGTVGRLTSGREPRGCLFVHGALACGSETEPIRKELNSRRGIVEDALRDRLRRAKTEGDLPSNASPADLAKFVNTVLHGMSVQASAGSPRKDLQRVADLALRVWPTAR
jgi:AcrR family transcriptional regulator